MHSPLDEVARLQSEVAGLRSELGVSERLRIAMFSNLAQKGDHNYVILLPCLKQYTHTLLLTHRPRVLHRRKKRTGGADSSCVYACIGV